MYADAVLQSGESIRAEFKLKHKLIFEDMIQFRQNVLKKKTELPIYVIITGSGNIPFEYVFIPGSWHKILVVTTTKGAENFREIIKAVPEYKKDKNVDEFLKGYQGEIVVLDPTSTAKFVDLKKLLYYLRHTHNVEFVDVTAGGKLIGEMAY